MPVVKIGFTPEPAVAEAPSDAAATSSEIKAQLWFENAYLFIAETFGRLANILVALLTPAAVVALVLGIWRVGVDLGWAGVFPISDGLFSHWQVWIALSIALKILSSTLIAWGARSDKFSQEN